MTKVACYIDGFNLYHAIDALGNDRLKWLNLSCLASTFLSNGEELERVLYFTSIMKWDHGKQQRHKEYIAALGAANVQCIISKFQRGNRYCSSSERYCNFQEEKQTDVALSSRIISDCLTTEINRVILVTADSDQVPTIATIKGLKPNISILTAFPPGRKKIGKELSLISHDSKEISQGRLSQCLFPRNVLDARGKIVARSPAKYQPSRFEK